MYFFAFQYSSWISSFLSVVFCILMVSVWSMTYDTCTNSRAFLGYHGGPVWYADHHSVEVLVSSISEAWLSLQDFPLAVHKHAFALFCVLWWLCLCDPDQSVVLLCWNDYMYPFSWLGWSLSWLIQMIVFSLRGWYKRYRSVVLVKYFPSMVVQVWWSFLLWNSWRMVLINYIRVQMTLLSWYESGMWGKVVDCRW
jgi:hypothetical protein